MNILIAPNNYYVMPGIVMLQSLFEHNTETMDIYVFESGLTIENSRKLENFIISHGAIPHMIHIPDTVFQDAPVSIHITKESYYRLLAQELLPENVERVLYLDLDMIIMDSLAPMYYGNFEYKDNECFFVVCEGPGVSMREWDTYDKLHIPHEYRYFNSGVLLMNLSLLRRKFDIRILFDFVTENNEILKYHDQDTLNALFFDKVKYVDWHKYNQTILHISNREESVDRLKYASIIHYAGSDKPWNYDYKSWYFELFWKYARKAGYKKEYRRVVFRRGLWHLRNIKKKFFYHK